MRSPLTQPLAHAEGSAGSTTILSEELCISIWAMAAAAPKFPSI